MESAASKILRDSILRQVDLREYNWIVSQNLELTVYRLENVRFICYELMGNGNPETHPVKLVIRYHINNSCKEYQDVSTCDNIDQAVSRLLAFPSTHCVCTECGCLMKKNSVCEDCEFFRAYCRYQEIPDKTCAICHEAVYRTMLQCGHAFHTTCITRMEPQNIKCPVCRRDLSVNEIEYFFFDEEEEEEAQH